VIPHLNSDTGPLRQHSPFRLPILSITHSSPPIPLPSHHFPSHPPPLTPESSSRSIHPSISRLTTPYAPKSPPPPPNRSCHTFTPQPPTPYQPSPSDSSPSLTSPTHPTTSPPLTLYHFTPSLFPNLPLSDPTPNSPRSTRSPHPSPPTSLPYYPPPTSLPSPSSPPCHPLPPSFFPTSPHTSSPCHFLSSRQPYGLPLLLSFFLLIIGFFFSLVFFLRCLFNELNEGRPTPTKPFSGGTLKPKLQDSTYDAPIALLSSDRNSSLLPP